MKRTLTKVAALAALAAMASIVLAGGAQGHQARSAKTPTYHLKANASGKLRFNRTTITVSSLGKKKFSLANPSSSGLDHALEIEGKGIEKESKTAAPGKTRSVTVTFKKTGTYEFYCPLEDHKDKGMKGKVKVKSG